MTQHDTKAALQKARNEVHENLNPERTMGVLSLETHITLLQVLDSALGSAAQEAEQWQPVKTAPKDETLFVCRAKNKPHVTFEACIYQDRESWEMPEEYDCLHNMTTDEPLCEDWDYYEWKPISATPTDVEKSGFEKAIDQYIEEMRAAPKEDKLS